MNRHAVIHIEEVENGLVMSFTDDHTRDEKPINMEHPQISGILASLKPKVVIATTAEDAAFHLKKYFNEREGVV